MITSADITVVFQGPVNHGAPSTADFIALARRTLPRSRFVLSTWCGSDLRGIDVDCVVLSEDPGGLPGIKHRDGTGALNNINRQLRSTQQGMAAVTTRYALKLRTDSTVDDAAFLNLYGHVQQVSRNPRLLTSSLFTLDPMIFEHMTYHVSDWVQFGETGLLRQYWSAPFMSAEDATYYEQHPYAGHSTFMDRRFRPRLAVEQHLGAHFAQSLGYPIPRYHNEASDEILEGHSRFMAEQLILMDPWTIRLRFPKYAWAYQSNFQRLNCFLHTDWHALYISHGEAEYSTPPPAGAIAARRLQKQVARLLARWTDRAGPWMVRPGFKQTVNTLLGMLAWQRRRAG